MKISTRGRYALRMMLDVSRHGGRDKPVSLASVSERTGISHGYLEQVALALRSARLVRGVAGRHGGYKLSLPPDKITIRQIRFASSTASMNLRHARGPITASAALFMR